MKPYAKKRYGQNFLIDPNILRKIYHTINPQKNEIIVEIGPGKGALTQYLAESEAAIHAIEIDADLIPGLKLKFGKYSNIVIHHQDALNFDYRSLLIDSNQLRIVGNIPYNITSPLLFTMFDNIEIIADIHFLVQREIARRICANPNTKEYGILSVLSQSYGNPKIEFDISPKVFRPIPEVTSTMLSIIFKKSDYSSEFKENFHTTVRTAFAKRRKTLKNTLTELIPENRMNCPIDLSRRAESLTVSDFILLTQWLFNKT
ncbi:MAG: 16S rRNA (adenine(1518)-N(6)/adenine(1519)-N(6))-dimethyltransferase RsmA [Candidatus Marinimicrobia bacterium]|nr:16S rRNA (adenine(1518)-N(6)/adenine(1519)-N(6))-dimethyltransferase RsmA [Candidatus Neomarinimicrobiota bacterium]